MYNAFRKINFIKTDMVYSRLIKSGHPTKSIKRGYRTTSDKIIQLNKELINLN